MRIKEAIELLEGVIYERNAIVSYSSELPEIYIKEKVALEKAVKVLKRYNRLMQVKAKPVKQRIKIQYEGEELTIKELVDRPRYALVDRDDWKELAEARYDWILELKKQLADAQTVRHGRRIAEDEDYEDSIYICSACGYEFVITAGNLKSNELNYCPKCGAKMDGEKKMEYENPCKNCKWHDVFWKGAGCNLLNNMEPCRFDAKDTNVPTKSEMEEEDDG